jgi:hypothetical protein
MRLNGVRPLLALTLVAAVGGCASEQGSAEQAIAAADSTLQTVAADAQAYVPDLYTAAGAQVAAARADFEAGNYPDALVKAQEAAADVGELGPAITARKDELTAAWTAMSDSLPGVVQAIQTRVDELSAMRRLPAGVTKEGLNGAKIALEDMTEAWTRAVEAHGLGNLADAASMGTSVKMKAAEVKAALGMK